MHAGKVVHGVLQNWNLARWRREPFQIERFKALFETQWQEQEKINWYGEEEDEKSSSLAGAGTLFH